MARRIRHGWLGPAIVLVGIVIAGFGTWYMVSQRPKTGAVIDTFPVDAKRSLVILAEDGGDRNFVELHDGARVVWQSIVPPYAGRPDAPGIAWSALTVTVRVIRADRAEVFAIAFANGSKLGGFTLAPGKGPAIKQAVGPVTLTDHARSYEVVSGAGWNQLVAIDLQTGQPLWKQDLDGAVIEAGGLNGNFVWIRQAGRTRTFGGADGVETASASST